MLQPIQHQQVPTQPGLGHPIPLVRLHRDHLQLLISSGKVPTPTNLPLHQIPLIVHGLEGDGALIKGTALLLDGLFYLLQLGVEVTVALLELEEEEGEGFEAVALVIGCWGLQQPGKGLDQGRRAVHRADLSGPPPAFPAIYEIAQ